MAFKMKKFSGFGNKVRTARAKRLIRKNVGNTTVDSPKGINEKKFLKSEKKMIKADKLLKKAGYSFEDRERFGGATGYKDAMDFATNKNKKK